MRPRCGTPARPPRYWSSSTSGLGGPASRPGRGGCARTGPRGGSKGGSSLPGSRATRVTCATPQGRWPSARTGDGHPRRGAQRLRRAGLRCDRISGGSTSTYPHSHELGLTEARPGNYVFLDRGETADLDRCALRWSQPSSPSPSPAARWSTRVRRRFRRQDRHATCAATAPSSVTRASRWSRSTRSTATSTSRDCDHAGASATVSGLIPNHACTCVNLHDRLVLVREGEVVDEVSVITRGMVR